MMFSTEQILNINGETDESLELALEFALKLSGEKSVKGFRKDPKGLAFYSFDDPAATSYPFTPTTKVLVEQIKDYIKSFSRTEVRKLIGPEPDIDGLVVLGWELFHPLWYGPNQLSKYDWSAFLAVRPCWIVYAK